MYCSEFNHNKDRIKKFAKIKMRRIKSLLKNRGCMYFLIPNHNDIKIKNLSKIKNFLKKLSPKNYTSILFYVTIDCDIILTMGL